MVPEINPIWSIMIHWYSINPIWFIHISFTSWWGARLKHIRDRSQNLLDAFDIGPRNVTATYTVYSNLWPLNFPG
jgi:hypothetical protein